MLHQFQKLHLLKQIFGVRVDFLTIVGGAVGVKKYRKLFLLTLTRINLRDIFFLIMSRSSVDITSTVEMTLMPEIARGFYTAVKRERFLTWKPYKQ